MLDILAPDVVLVTRHAYQSDGQVEPQFVLPSTHVFSKGLRPVIDFEVAGWSALRLVLRADINCDHHLPAWLTIIGYDHGVPNCRASLSYFSWSLIIHELLHHLAAYRSLYLAVKPNGALGSAASRSAVNDPRTWFALRNATVHSSQRV